MMRSLIASCFGLLLSWPASGLAATVCKHPYERILPFNLPIGSDKAYVALNAQLSFNYDCRSFIAQGDASIFGSVLDLELDLLNTQVTTYTGVGAAPGSYEAANAYAKVMVMGYEIVRKDIDLAEAVDIHPSHDIDFSDTMYFNVGPVPVPLSYGVEGEAGLSVKGGVHGFSVGIDLSPDVTTNAYVQAGVDVLIAKAFARGDLVVIHDKLKNRVQIGIEDAEQLSLRVTAHSTNELKALEGSVSIQASAMSKEYNSTLFDWPGYSREDLLFEFSDRVALTR